MAISLLVQIFLLTTLFSPTISKTIVTQCLEHQKTLLLELKKELVSDPLWSPIWSPKLAQWNKRDDDCCRWKGVECDGAGRVISLQLDVEAINSGRLNDSSSLFNLEYLEKLNLAHTDDFCEGSHPIPRGIEKLTYLTHLNLSCAGFSGKIPIEFSHVMRRLVSLDLSYSEGIEPLSLMAIFHNLTQLRELYLDGMNLSSLEIHVTASSTPGLTKLSLRECSLSGPLDHSLSQLHSLSVLQLDGNNLSTVVPDFFANFPSLTTLSLFNCSLSGPLDHSLSQLHSLSVLLLDYNNLSTVVPDFFAKFSSLTTLSLTYCNLKGYFPEKIFQIPTLQNLDLSFNEFLGGTIPQFPRTTSFRTIRIQNTNFSGSLPDSISNLKNLSDLHLSECQFTGPIPSTLGNLTELVDVDLSSNFFTGSISSIHFEGPSSLTFIDLHNNALTGSIPTSIFALPSLHTLDFSENQFSGQVNEFPVVNISNLNTLDLSRNRLEGPIPNSFFQLQSLQNLLLSDNSLMSLDTTGIRSSSKNFSDLVNQSTLILLDLSNNKFAGEIPSWIWEIGNGGLSFLNLSCNMFVDLKKPYNITSFYLESLDLHSNQLRGELPLLLIQGDYVDCSNNYFEKLIPNTGNFSYLRFDYLSLANNRLSGSFPTSLCNSSLQILDMSVNNLSGSIPPCIIERSYVLVLSLSRNNISGRIPDNFSQDCYLKTLDLNDNNLVGRVPRSLGNCKSLAAMNVGTNHIDDIFPCMLPSSLQILVLRSNRFHGEVRCLGSLPNLQIIDIASNNLSGYLNSSSFSHWRGMTDAMSRNSTSVTTDSHMQGSYQDEVMLIIKGLELKLVKIWPEFTAIDFSCNNFQGDIPDSIGELNALHLLNLSHNSLTGTIPRSFSNLTQLESLDLSVNQLTGEIPQKLAGLTFLQIMNLSHNNLVGKIPVGPQIQTFSPDSFEGNTGLCGLPLNISCKGTSQSPPKLSNVQSGGKAEIEWEYVFAALGYVVGLGSIVWVFLCCRSIRDKYFDKIEDVFEKILDRRQQRRKRRRGATRVVRNQVTRQQ